MAIGFILCEFLDKIPDRFLSTLHLFRSAPQHLPSRTQFNADLQKKLAVPADAALFVNGTPAKRPHFLDQRRVSVSRNGRGGYSNGGRRERKEERRESWVLIVTGKVTEGQIVGGPEERLIVGIGVLRSQEGNI